MKINGFGQAEILKPEEISLLFREGFVNPRDRALLGVCLYAGARINEACTLLKGDVITPTGVRSKLIIRSYNTKGGRDTREIQIHPILKDYFEVYAPLIKARGKNPHSKSQVSCLILLLYQRTEDPIFSNYQHPHVNPEYCGIPQPFLL